MFRRAWLLAILVCASLAACWPGLDHPSQGPASCGALDQPCCSAGESATPCGAGLLCGATVDRLDAGASRVCQRCPAGLWACGERCVDLSRDPGHCGACGRACNAGEACARGSCACAVAGQTSCLGAGCVSLATDNSNCGRCGNVCPTGVSCAAGVCACAVAGQVYCAGVGCVDTQSSATHCGVCGRACAAGMMCRGGACGCPAGQTQCGAGGCVNTQADSANCGACGRSCAGAFPGATAVCASGACTLSTCRAGFGDCTAAPGCETDLRATLESCGVCGNRCAFSNAAAACTGGACVMGACAPGFADCNASSADGCETGLRTDANNCGRCRAVCPTPTGRTASCVGGTCALGTLCSPPLADCNGVSADGCETDVRSDARNCGACGASCLGVPSGADACAAGRCACAAGFFDCDASRENGCESTTAC